MTWWLEQEHAREAYFDLVSQAWVLSRYVYVQAALHEPRLWLVGPARETAPATTQREEQARSRMETLTFMHPAKVLEWREKAERGIREVIAGLPPSRAIEVVGEVARPWALALAAQVCGVEANEIERFAALAR